MLKNCDVTTDDSYILPPSRWESWLMVTGAFIPEYHQCGDYYQVDLSCVVMDGCTDVKEAILALTTSGENYVQLEHLRMTYQREKVFKISAQHFSVSSTGSITFYGNPVLEQLTPEEELAAKVWFDCARARLMALGTRQETHETMIGTVVGCDVMRTKSGLEMAFVKLDSYQKTKLMLFPEKYSDYREMLATRSLLMFSGPTTRSTDEEGVMVVETISCQQESKGI